MKYSLRSQYYSDFSTIDINRLPARSYFVPYPDRQSQKDVSIVSKRYGSPLVRCLNGNWDFAYFNDPKDLPEQLNTDAVKFDSLDVPSCWQYRGYGRPMYLNVRYPFAYNPPKIPTTEPVGRYFSYMNAFTKAPEDEMNHVGLYRTFFDVQDLSKDYIISFLGVCSCIEVHLNGRFIGYSEESHNTAEFNLTEDVIQGKNELVCVVRRWCNGSYLECQDMFRNNGIFRDVLLRVSDKAAVWDVDFRTKKENGLYSAQIEVFPRNGRAFDAKVTLEGKGLSRTSSVSVAGASGIVSFEDLEVEQWSAETPVLYDLYIETSDACIHQRVGFKDIQVKGNLYLLNDHKIKFKGVNHHDTDPKNGYCMTAEQILRDLELCKAFNIDTVRTSHYAPDPVLLELAAELGLYIVDEVDIETHGVFAMVLPPNMNRISRNRRWVEHYVSRASRHYHRDKILTTPIVMWSLGNESGGGVCTDAEYDFFHRVSSIPVHYESAIYTRRKAYDIASRMYPPTKELHQIGEGKCKTKQFMDRPYFMCEYAHAMGVGPGNIEGYWKEIYNYDGLIGGCVWEMNDHAVDEGNGNYTYGGDHGEWIHDGNFCCDGIFYPDRSPSTGAWIVRHAYRPIRLSRLEDGSFEVFNTTAFTSGDAYTMKIRISNGKAFEFVPSAEPLSKQIVNWNLGDISGDCFLEAETYDRKGALVSTEQIALGGYVQPEFKDASLPSWFGLEDGLPVISVGDSKVVSADPYTILFRAETDNDSINFVLRPMRKWYRQQTTLVGSAVNGDSAVSEWVVKVGRKTFLCTDSYQGVTGADGKQGVLVSSLIHPLKVRGKLPRFGKTFKLESSFDGVEYLGRSGESYVDMKEQFPIKTCECKVADMVEPNVRPQESGNRCDTRFVELSDGNHKVRIDAFDKPFELSVKPYGDRDLIGMKHRCDEKTLGTYLTINAFQQGIGTGSCGPYALDEHCYDASGDYSIKFSITVD